MRLRLHWANCPLLTVIAVVIAFADSPRAFAADPPVSLPDNAPTGAPPPDAKALVKGPDAPKSAPDLDAPPSGSNIALSAGGMWAAGNSRQLAATAHGEVEFRRKYDGIGLSFWANYGEAAPAGADRRVTTQNVQDRVRYDRYLSKHFSVFGIVTGRHDRFQGLQLRTNLDPGVKYLFLNRAESAVWIEAGYDFQYDVRRDEARIPRDASGKLTTGPWLPKRATDHSTRLFFGFRHAFNTEVSLSSGIEYLQSVVDSTRYRLNYDALFAAKVGAGLALGFGFTARYDHAPLPGKEELDTSTTVSLIYSFTDAAPPAKTCLAAPASRVW